MMNSFLPTTRAAAFVVGAISAWSLSWLRERFQQNRRLLLDDHDHDDNNDATATTSMSRSSSTNKKHSPPSIDNGLMDAANLDLRMLRKAEGVIRYRTSGITIVIERCSNDWNYSAILRTAEALGIQTVYIIDPPAEANVNMVHLPAAVPLTATEVENRRNHHLFAQNATEFLTIQNFASSQDCLEKLREEQHVIYATDLSQTAVPLMESTLCAAAAKTHWPVFPKKLALVFGTEAVGVSPYVLQQADACVYLPLYGFADSLNLSVATALVVYAVLQLEPRYIGHMSETERTALRRLWFPKLAQQRLLTPSQKKQRKKLITKITACEDLKFKPKHELTAEQLVKLNDRLPQYQQELRELEESAKYHKGAEQAVEEYIQNPPEPLTDLRRVDAHRVGFVGKNAKHTIFTSEWKVVPPKPLEETNSGAAANFFRTRAQRKDINQ